MLAYFYMFLAFCSSSTHACCLTHRLRLAFRASRIQASRLPRSRAAWRSQWPASRRLHSRDTVATEATRLRPPAASPTPSPVVQLMDSIPDPRDSIRTPS